MKKLIVLITCLTLSLSANSQTLSNDSCLVPCYTLGNALKVKAERDLFLEQLKIARDSVHIQDTIIFNQDLLISNMVSQIEIHKSNEKNHEEVIKNKDSVIDEYKKLYKKERRQKFLGFGVGLASIVFSLFLVL